MIGKAPDEGKKGTRVTFLASTEKTPGDGGTFKNQIEYDFDKLEHHLSRAGIPQFGRAPVPPRRADEKVAGDPNDPLLLQVLPIAAELQASRGLRDRSGRRHGPPCRPGSAA